MSIAVILTIAGMLIPQALEPEVIAERVQNVYDQQECITCDFLQIYISGTSGKAIEEKGTLLIKKPGKMRWEYNDPDEKLYVSDGQTVYWYVPADQQVTKMELDTSDTSQTQILFLTGKGNILRDFSVSMETEERPDHEGSHMLRLVPNSEQSFDYLVLEVNPRDYFVERLISFDPLGNIMEYRFLNIRESQANDSQFTFEVPRGVEVMEAGS